MKAHGGPKLSGNSACLCSPARTILQHLSSLILSQNLLQRASLCPLPLLAMTGFGQEHSLPRHHFKPAVPAHSGTPRVCQNRAVFFLCGLPGNAAGSSGPAAWDRRSGQSLYRD